MDSTTATGYLRIKVSSGEGAFPIEDAIVLISPNNKENNGVLYSLRTDSSGLTEEVPLPTKPKSLSESPGTPSPFFTYNIETKKDGYYTVNNMNVPVFEGVRATLPVNLVPLVLGDNQYSNKFTENRNFLYVTNEALSGEMEGENE